MIASIRFRGQQGPSSLTDLSWFPRSQPLRSRRCLGQDRPADHPETPSRLIDVAGSCGFSRRRGSPATSTSANSSATGPSSDSPSVCFRAGRAPEAALLTTRRQVGAAPLLRLEEHAPTSRDSAAWLRRTSGDRSTPSTHGLVRAGTALVSSSAGSAKRTPSVQAPYVRGRRPAPTKSARHPESRKASHRSAVEARRKNCISRRICPVPRSRDDSRVTARNHPPRAEDPGLVHPHEARTHEFDYTVGSSTNRGSACGDDATTPRDPAYGYYGAKGAAVCGEWDDFKAFHDWALASGWEPQLCLSRKSGAGLLADELPLGYSRGGRSRGGPPKPKMPPVWTVTAFNELPRGRLSGLAIGVAPSLFPVCCGDFATAGIRREAISTPPEWDTGPRPKRYATAFGETKELLSGRETDGKVTLVTLLRRL